LGMIGDTNARRFAIHQHPLMVSGVTQTVNDVHRSVTHATATKQSSKGTNESDIKGL
jgi:hypothetical protein